MAARIHPAEYPPHIWAMAKADYLSPEAAKVVADRYGVSESALHKRAAREGWSRSAIKRKYAAAQAVLDAVAGAPQPALDVEPIRPAPASEPAPFLQAVGEDPLAIAVAALTRARGAFGAGRPAEAQAHIKAGLALAELAEVVRGLRQMRGST